MNTEVEVAGAEFDLEPWFRRVEAVLTRFDPASPLCQLNAAAGSWVLVPPLLYRAVAAALQAARETGGAYDPTVLAALEAAGYSRSFELGPQSAGQASPAGRWSAISLEPRVGVIRLPAGVRLDLGGIGKGLAVDGAAWRARREAKRQGRPPSYVVNAGGDLAVQASGGEPPVQVHIDDPLHPGRNLASLRLRRGAVATSSTLGRRWGEGLHHIIDPRTGRPADSGVAAATVVAGMASRAETLAKACIVLGAERGMELLKSKGCLGILVTDDGSVLLSPGMEDCLHEPA
ncbi:MAG: FAD:protein FMN transferase [Bacillota bacterium]